MSDTIERVTKLIEGRLRKLDGEAAALNRTLNSLKGGGGSQSGRRPGGRKKQGARKGGRAKRGQRREQFLKVVEAQPGVRPSEIAAKMGVSQSQVHGLAGRLQKAGEITKSGKGYKLKKSSA